MQRCTISPSAQLFPKWQQSQNNFLISPGIAPRQAADESPLKYSPKDRQVQRHLLQLSHENRAIHRNGQHQPWRIQATYNHSLSVCVPLGTQQTRISSTLLLLACCGAVGSHFAAVCLSFPSHRLLIPARGREAASAGALLHSPAEIPTSASPSESPPEASSKKSPHHLHFWGQIVFTENCLQETHYAPESGGPKY